MERSHPRSPCPLLFNPSIVPSRRRRFNPPAIFIRRVVGLLVVEHARHGVGAVAGARQQHGQGVDMFAEIGDRLPGGSRGRPKIGHRAKQKRMPTAARCMRIQLVGQRWKISTPVEEPEGSFS